MTYIHIHVTAHLGHQFPSADKSDVIVISAARPATDFAGSELKLPLSPFVPYFKVL